MAQKTYHFKLLLKEKQHEWLKATTDHLCELYNSALEHRILAYAKGVRITKYDQDRELTELRKDSKYTKWSVATQRGALVRLDEAFKGFFRRAIKNVKRPGFPRFRSKARYNTIDFRAVKVTGNRVRLNGMLFKFNRHRDMAGAIKLIRLTKHIDQWVISFICEVEPEATPINNTGIGIDLGLTDLVTLSDGTTIKRPNYTKKYAPILSKAHRRFERAKRGSSNKRRRGKEVARVHQSIVNARKTKLHQITRQLVNRFGHISVEKLTIVPMLEKKSGLEKHIHDASWATFLHMIRYKAEWAGCTIEEVNPRGTTQNCSGCGIVVPKDLYQRWHSCPDCGLSLSRDVNAARNIAIRANFDKGVVVLGLESREYHSVIHYRGVEDGQK